MPVALLILGFLAIMTALKGNTSQVISTVTGDLTGSGSFLLWIGSIIFIAVAGKIMNIPRASKLFIGLIVLVYFISNSGVFTQLETAFANVSAPSPTPAVPVNADNTTTAPAATAPSTSPATGGN
jgi:hypothetical protein